MKQRPPRRHGDAEENRNQKLTWGELLGPLWRGQHFAPQDRIDPGLVALALLLQPIQYIGVNASGDLALARAVELPSPGILPLFLRHFRNIAGVDLPVGTSRQRF